MAPRLRFDRPIAHRGLHDRGRGVIENSRSAFEAAVAGGFDIECDLQLSSDGMPVVFHDDDLERLTGLTGTVGSLTTAELVGTPLLGSTTGDTPQPLTDLLEQIRGRTLLQIELKHQPTTPMREQLATATAAALAGYAGPVAVESFDPHLLTAIRRHGYTGPLGIITYDYMDDTEAPHLTARERFALRHLLHWPSTRFEFISCHFKALRLPAVRLFGAVGMPVTTWTIRSGAEASQARAAGANQIVFEGFDPGRV